MATKTDDSQREQTLRAPCEGRARAARYLDLWERAVALACVQGTPPPIPAPGPRTEE